MRKLHLRETYEKNMLCGSKTFTQMMSRVIKSAKKNGNNLVSSKEEH